MTNVNFATVQVLFEAASPDDQIAMAKQLRVDIMEILEACTCLMPFRVHDIVHDGHAPDCAAVPVLERVRARRGFA
jgi:hypothetical protein